MKENESMIEEVLDQFDKLLDYVAGNEDKPVLWNKFKPLCDILYRRYLWIYMPDFVRPEYFIPSEFTSRKVVLCFTGGFKSTFAALYYKLKGVDVRLYFRYFRKDHYQKDYFLDFAETMAKRLQLPLYVDFTPVYWQLQTKYLEVLNGAIVYALSENICSSSIAVGSFYNLSLKNNSFEKYGGQTKEFMDAYENVWNNVIQDFRIEHPFMNFESLWMFAQKHEDYMYYFRAGDYMYILWCDYGLEPNPDYRRYVLSLYSIRAEYISDTGEPVETAEMLWKKCFFYNIAKSHFYSELKDYRFKKKEKLSC